MEAAALFAVAQFREVILGQVAYGGDLVVPEGWDFRNWVSRKGCTTKALRRGSPRSQIALRSTKRPGDPILSLVLERTHVLILVISGDQFVPKAIDILDHFATIHIL